MYRWRSCRRRSYVLAKISPALFTGRPTGVRNLAPCRRIPVPPAALLKNNPDPGKAFAEFDRKLDRSQFGPRWLRDTRIASMVISALEFGDKTRHSHELAAWVIMPNHVHIVIAPHDPLPQIMRWLKTATANRANKILGLSNTPFWQREYYDH
jgi:hypothetical protein